MTATQSKPESRGEKRSVRRKKTGRNPQPRQSSDGTAWYRGTLAPALAGSALLWLALPPVGFAPLAWVAPVPWLLLARRPELPGRRPYLKLWIAGFVFWMAALHWLRLPYLVTGIGWVALSFYLAFYLPVFVGLVRVAVHDVRVPLVLAAPTVWTGLELARGHLLTGFGMASLGHTQYRWIELIQIADLAGAYGVGFVVMFAAACLARTVRSEDGRPTPWPLVPLVIMLCAVLIYGSLRTDVVTRPGPIVALIQGSIDSEMKADQDRRFRVYEEYFGLSAEARRARDDLDLIVWPETMFRDPLLVISDGARPAAGESWTLEEIKEQSRRNADQIRYTAEALHTRLLLGIDTLRFGPDTIENFNSALFVDTDGTLLGRYDKMHPVMFGEYVPGGNLLPWIYYVTPLRRGLTAGERSRAFEVDDALFCPSICYETVLPHVIRCQVNQLAAEGREPDVLVNLTNDGWFRGSSELDLHLICGVFRAVECRKPLLIAANTGFSAWIDGNGVIEKQGRRRATDIIIADVELDDRRSLYLRYGDWPAGVCLALTAVLAVVGYRNRRSQQAG